MNGRRTLFLVFLFAWIGEGIGLAEEVRVVATVDATRVEVGEYIRYTLQVHNAGKIRDSAVSFPKFEGFVVDRQSPSSRMETYFENGRMTAKNYIEYPITLIPNQPGRYKIEPAILRHGGKIYSSDGFTIEVVSTDQSTGTLDVLRAYTGDSNIDKQIRGRLFLKTDIANREPYVGEQIPLAYYLFYSNLQLSGNIVLLEEPDFTSFLVEEYEISGGIIKREKMIDGEKFMTYLFRKVALFPAKTGEFNLSPYKLQVNLRTQGRGRRRSRGFFDNFFDDPFFGGSTITATVPSEPITLNVRQVPTDGKPEDFRGVVGDYRFDYSIDKTQVEEGEPVSLKIIISGRGQIDALSEPNLPQIDGFDLYGIEKNTEKHWDAEGFIAGIGTFDIVLRSNKPGNLTIPPIRYPIFNPVKDKYEIFATEPIVIYASPIAKTVPMDLVQAQQQTTIIRPDGRVETINVNIRHIKNSGFDGRGMTLNLLDDGVFVSVQILPVLFLGGAFLVRCRRRRLESDLGYRRSIFAKGSAHKRLSEARKAIKHDDEVFYGEVHRALTNYIADKFNISAAGLTIEQVIAVFDEGQVDEETKSSVREMLERCDFARFTLSQSSLEEKRKILKQASDAINALEKKVRS